VPNNFFFTFFEKKVTAMTDKGNVYKDAQETAAQCQQLVFNVRVQKTGGEIKQTLMDLTEENKKNGWNPTLSRRARLDNNHHQALLPAAPARKTAVVATKPGRDRERY